jgi:hypothetical protein
VSAHSDYFGFLARELGDPGSLMGNPAPEDLKVVATNTDQACQQEALMIPGPFDC